MPDAETAPKNDAPDGRIPIWLWPNVLALDAPVVAMAWQYLFAEALKFRIPPVQYAVLGLIVWAIYSADRVVDAARLAKPATASHRHRFYHRHLKLMATATAIGALLAGYAVLTVLPQNIIVPGAALGGLVALYFVHRISADGPVLAIIPKEVFSGIVFALGTTLLGFTWSSRLPSGLVSGEVWCFGALCALNCLAISVWERNEDAGNDPNAVAQWWPGSVAALPKLALSFTFFGAVAAGLAWWRGDGSFPILLAAAAGMALIAGLAHRASSMRPAALRVGADLAVLLPALACLPLTPWASTG